MRKTLQEELNRLTNKAFELGYISNEEEVSTQENSFGALWVTIPNVHGKGKGATFTILSNKDGTEFDTVTGKIGK